MVRRVKPKKSAEQLPPQVRHFEHPIVVGLVLALVLFVVVGNPQKQPALSATADLPVPEYYFPAPAPDTTFSNTTILGERSLVTGGFPQISTSPTELNKIIMIRLGTFTPIVALDLAKQLVNKYIRTDNFVPGLDIDAKLKAILTSVVEDGYAYKIFDTFMRSRLEKGDGGVFSVIDRDDPAMPPNANAAYSPFNDPVRIKIATDLVRGTKENAQRSLFHESLHYFFDRIDSVLKLDTLDTYTGDPDTQPKNPFYDEHSVIDPLSARFYLVNRMRRPLIERTNSFKMLIDKKIRGLTLIDPALGIPIGTKIRQAFVSIGTTRSDPAVTKAKTEELMDYLNRGSFYRNFVEVTMAHVKKTDTFPNRPPAFHQDVAYMWAYFAALLRGELVLESAVINSPCVTLANYRQVLKDNYALFVSRLGDVLYANPRASINNESQNIMKEIILKMNSCTLSCPVR